MRLGNPRPAHLIDQDSVIQAEVRAAPFRPLTNNRFKLAQNQSAFGSTLFWNCVFYSDKRGWCPCEIDLPRLPYAVVLMLGMSVLAAAQDNAVQQPLAREQLEYIHTAADMRPKLSSFPFHTVT